MRPIQLSVQIDGIKANKDRTLMIKLETQELSPNDASEVFNMMNKQLWMALAEAPLKENELEVPDVVGEFKNELSPSQLQRNILYRIWEQKTDKTQTFPDWYKAYMFKSNNKLKEKLD